MISLPPSVLPVIDLMGGKVVHARAGRRAEYQPLVSQWCEQAHDPTALTGAIRQQIGVNEYYLADLDALGGRVPQRDLIVQLVKSGYRLWLDAGVRTVKEAEDWLTLGVERVIVASETLPSAPALTELYKTDLADRLIFSLDLMQGKLRSMPGAFSNDEPLAVIEQVAELGCRQFIVLDTAAVGISNGPTTLDLCRQIHERYPHCTIISGGGVRHRKDIEDIENAGVERVLVSTWLHQGCP